MVLEHIGTAVPVHLNFATSNMDRVACELRAALHRHKKQVLMVRHEVQQTLRNELKSTITALLLSCELAMSVPNVPVPAVEKIRVIDNLARELRLRLEVN